LIVGIRPCSYTVENVDFLDFAYFKQQLFCEASAKVHTFQTNNQTLKKYFFNKCDFSNSKTWRVRPDCSFAKLYQAEEGKMGACKT
jgi:hypothetical protein